MIEYDEIENKMVLKLVYYGPALSGKTTNLLNLHDILDEEGRGGLTVLDSKDDRTIFFDLLPFEDDWNSCPNCGMTKHKDSKDIKERR